MWGCVCALGSMQGVSGGDIWASLEGPNAYVLPPAPSPPSEKAHISPPPPLPPAPHQDALVIGAKFDTTGDTTGDTCRLAFYGRLAALIDPTKEQEMARLKVYKVGEMAPAATARMPPCPTVAHHTLSLTVWPCSDFMALPLLKGFSTLQGFCMMIPLIPPKVKHGALNPRPGPQCPTTRHPHSGEDQAGYYRAHPA